jgi:hypothetical protein
MSYSYYDDLALGACWLYKATGAPAFLQECQQHYASHLAVEARAANATVFDFRRGVWAVDVLLYSITKLPKHADRWAARRLLPAGCASCLGCQVTQLYQVLVTVQVLGVVLIGRV